MGNFEIIPVKLFGNIIISTESGNISKLTLGVPANLKSIIVFGKLSNCILWQQLPSCKWNNPIGKKSKDWLKLWPNRYKYFKVDGKLWAVNGDVNSDGDGGLITSHSWLTIAGKGIIVVGDSANPDDLCPVPGGPHCNPASSSGDDLIKVL